VRRLITSLAARRQRPAAPSESSLVAWAEGANLAFQRKLFASSLNTRQRISLYKRLALMLANNLSLAEAAAETYVVVSGRVQAFDKDADWRRQVVEMLAERPRDARARLLQDVLRNLARGVSIADAFGLWVTHQEATLIRSGERTAQLVDAFKRCIFILRKRAQLTAALRSQLALPVIVSIAVLAALLFVGYDLVPQYLRLRPLEQWQGPTRTLIVVCSFVKRWAPVLIPTLVATVWIVAWTMPRWRGPWRDRADRLPPYNVYRMFQGSTFMLILSAQMASGEPVAGSLESMLANATPYLRERISDALRGLARGLNLGQALHHSEHGFPDREAISFMRSLASRDGFAQALENSIEDWIDITIDQLGAMAAVIRTIVIGIAMAVMLMMFKGMYGISQAAHLAH